MHDSIKFTSWFIFREITVTAVFSTFWTRRSRWAQPQLWWWWWKRHRREKLQHLFPFLLDHQSWAIFCNSLSIFKFRYNVYSLHNCIVSNNIDIVFASSCGEMETAVLGLHWIKLSLHFHFEPANLSRHY